MLNAEPNIKATCGILDPFARLYRNRKHGCLQIVGFMCSVNNELKVTTALFASNKLKAVTHLFFAIFVFCIFIVGLLLLITIVRVRRQEITHQNNAPVNKPQDE
jgi:hypothetical protein